MRRLPEGSRVICMGGTVRLMTQREFFEDSAACMGEPRLPSWRPGNLWLPFGFREGASLL